MSTPNNGPFLPIVQLTIAVEFVEPFRKPAYAGSMLRGQFGRMLKRRACITRAASCEGCTIRATCPVICLFESPGNNLPPPYMVHDPKWGVHTIEPGETWCFRHTLLGQNAITQAPLVIHVWDALLRSGLGPERVRGHVELISDHLGQIAESADSLILQRQIQPLHWPQELGNKVTIHLNTPLRLFFQNRQIRPQHFQPEHFFKALWHRLQALRHAPYGFDRILQLDAQTREALFDSQLEIHTLGWRRLKRYSTRQQVEQDMSGLVGRFTIHPADEKVARLIWLGQQVHIGKNTVFGLGHYEARFSDRL